MRLLELKNVDISRNLCVRVRSSPVWFWCNTSHFHVQRKLPFKVFFTWLRRVLWVPNVHDIIRICGLLPSQLIREMLQEEFGGMTPQQLAAPVDTVEVRE